MKILVLLTGVGAMILAGCQPMPPPPVPPDSVVDADVPPDDIPDAAPPPASIDAGDVFDQACENLRRLHCDDGFDKAGQQSCAFVMRRAETKRLTKTYPQCVAGANAVSAVRQCGRYCAIIRK